MDNGILKIGYLRNDEDGHDFLVPQQEVFGFDVLYNEICDLPEESDLWYEKIDEFSKKYSQYMLSGGTHNLKIIMENL
jgi:hypothetical protein